MLAQYLLNRVAWLPISNHYANFVKAVVLSVPAYLLPSDTVIHKRALYNEQLGPVQVWVAILLKQLATGVTCERNLRHLQPLHTRYSKQHPHDVLMRCQGSTVTRKPVT